MAPLRFCKITAYLIYMSSTIPFRWEMIFETPTELLVSRGWAKLVSEGDKTTKQEDIFWDNYSSTFVLAYFHV